MDNEVVKELLDIVKVGAASKAGELLYISMHNKVKTFINNLRKKHLDEIDLDILTSCLSNLQISQKELSKTYSYIINNISSNDKKDKILSYFNTLSQLTLSDIQFLKRLYPKASIEIDENTILEDRISVVTLSKFHLIRLENIRTRQFDGGIHGCYILSDIGKDFMKHCTNNVNVTL